MTAARLPSSIWQGNKKSLSAQWFTIQGLAWSPDGKEIWFTASKSGTDRTLYATSLDGKQRIVARLPGALMLLDIAKDGRVLLVRATWRRELLGVWSTVIPSSANSPGSTTPIPPICRRMARLCCSTKKAEAARWPTPNPAA